MAINLTAAWEPERRSEPEEAVFHLSDPNTRANLVSLRVRTQRHYTVIDGLDRAGHKMGGFHLRIPTDAVYSFCLALQHFHAGELGRMAIEAEAEQRRKQREDNNPPD